MSSGSQQAVRSYQTIGAHAQVAAADPYRLVQLLLAKLLERLAAARGHMERREIARKGEQVSKAIEVLSALDASINMEQGGEIAANLRGLYGYMSVRLARANAEDDPAGIEEVAALVRNIKDGWDGIGPAVQAAAAAGATAVP
jgi:flagellar secretion chaperone FliS